jgi:hypothetical protein
MRTMEFSPAIRRRRFRFGLRTLLAVVTLAAVGSWAYCVGWPWWKLHQEQMQFESLAKHLKANVSDNQVWDRLAANPSYRIWWNKTDGEPSEQYYLVPNKWPNAVYFVSSVKSKSDGKWLRHQVYRLSSNSSEEAFRDSIGSLVRFLNRGQTGDPGFPYEVIYSDPPETPAAK